MAKNQHYVPRTYLKHFKTPESKEAGPQVHTYDKNTNKYIGNPNIKKVANEKWFYDFADDTEHDKQSVENHLSSLETQAAPLLVEMTRTQSIIGFNFNDRTVFAHFLAAQYYRTRKFRDLTEWSLRQVLDAAKHNPKGFKEFIAENSRHTIPDLERIYSEHRIDLSTRRLEAYQLPSYESAKRLSELDRELERFEKRYKEFLEFKEEYKQGKAPEGYVETMEWHLKNLPEDQAGTLRLAVPKLAQILLEMEWKVRPLIEGDFYFTSDHPLVLIPLERPAREEDVEAFYMFYSVNIGVVHFSSDIILKELPSIAFIFPLTPHLELCIAPPNSSILDGEKARSFFKLLQVMQAHRFIYSAYNDFAGVSDAIDTYKAYKKYVEEDIPAIMSAHPETKGYLPSYERWLPVFS